MPFVRCATVTLLCVFSTQIAFGQSPPDHATIKTFNAAPSYFIANTTHHKTGKKLIEDDVVVAFVQTQQGRVLFTPGGAYIGMAVPAGDPSEPFEHHPQKMDPFEHGRDFARPTKTAVMKVGFDVARAKKRNIVPRLEDKTDHIVSFFLGSKENWQTGLPTYRKLVYQNVWDGIDLEYLAYQDRLEFQVVIEQGADPSAIVMETGAERLELLESGELTARLREGTLRLSRPFAYQEVGDHRQEVVVAYTDEGKGRFGFVLGNYDSSKPLIIDPELIWSTFQDGPGGYGYEIGWDLALDTAGNTYITGYSPAADFPVTVGSFDETWNGGTCDAFVSKLNADGTDMVFSAFLGGIGADQGHGIVVDGLGHTFVTGYSYSADFPTTNGSFDETYNGNADIFVCKLDSAGVNLIYSTFLGGSIYEIGYDIALDATDNAFVTGSTTSSDFPTTSGSFDETYDDDYDVFVSKLNGDGTDLIYSTFIGSSGRDNGFGIAVTASGNACVTGETTSADFPVTSGAFDETFNGNWDVFVCRINGDGTDLDFSTFIGSPSSDRGKSIGLDGLDNVFVIGSTWSSDYPTTVGAYDETYNGDVEAFVTKLNATGTDLSYSTFLGGSYEDWGFAIAVDTAGNAHVTGIAGNDTFPTTPGAFNDTFAGAFVAKLDETGSDLVYSTFIGPSSSGYGIAVDGAGEVVVTGHTSSSFFPTTPGAFDESYNGGHEAFVSKLNGDGSGLSYSTFLGGSEVDDGHAIAVDGSGNVYTTGRTTSSMFPVTSGVFDETFNGDYDVFVSKLDSHGSDLGYATYLGGTYAEEGLGITVDSSGNAYVTGYSRSIEFPTTSGSFDETHNGDSDIFLTQLNSSGTVLIYSTFVGGSDADVCTAVALDGLGNAYLTGRTSSTDFPTTGGAFDVTQNGANDAFVSKLNGDGSGLIYSTFLGGPSTDQAAAIAVNASGNAYVTGRTWSTGFPTTSGSFDQVHNGDWDAFVTKLDVDGTGLTFSTFLGGSSTEYGYGIDLDDSGDAYITGATYSAGFPTTSGSFDPYFNRYFEVFVSKLGASGSDLIYSTFLGSLYYEDGFGIAVDAFGNAHVTGQTSSFGFPTTSGAFDESFNGRRDAFVSTLDADGAVLMYSTFLGGTEYDEGLAIAADNSGKVYVIGKTLSVDFPATPGVFQEAQVGHGGIFVACFDHLCFPGPIATVSGDASICLGDSTTIEATLTGTPPWNLTWTDGFEQLNVTVSPVTRVVSPTRSMEYSVTQFSDAYCTKAGTGRAVVAIDPYATVFGDAYICNGQSTTVQANLTGTPPWNVTWSDGTQHTNVTESLLVHNVSPTVTTVYRVTQVEDANCVGISSNQATVTVENGFAVGTLPRVGVAQGLVPQVFEAFAVCDSPPTEFEWTIPAMSYSFGIDVNPITLDPIPSQTTDYQIRVTDQSVRATLYHTVRLLVAVDTLYFDLNGDGCNNVADIWALCDDWRTEMPILDDPNGDGIVDVLDFLYLNLDDPYPCPVE